MATIITTTFNTNTNMGVDTMATFIASMIITQKDDVSLESAQALYRKYFITQSVRFGKYRADVDFILTVEGYGDCIVTQ